MASIKVKILRLLSQKNPATHSGLVLEIIDQSCHVEGRYHWTKVQEHRVGWTGAQVEHMQLHQHCQETCPLWGHWAID